MMDAQQQNELLLKIEQLSQQVSACRHEIDALKEALHTLQQHGRIYQPPASVRASAPRQWIFFENFIGLRLIHFVGIVVLLAGLSIGVKYAIDVNLITPALRIVLAYVAGAALFVMSVRLQRAYLLFSMILFSGAMASFYFTTYGAFAYYRLLPVAVAFVVMLLLTVGTVLKALHYNRQQVAILGLVGAYAIPFFVRGNAENISGLFGYVLLINTGILVLSLQKYWVNLRYTAFFSTWIIFGTLLLVKTTQLYIGTGILFASVYFILFTVASVGYAFFKKMLVEDADAIIIAINTVCFYSALAVLFGKMGGDVTALLTLCFGGVYLLAAIATKMYVAGQKRLVNTLLSVALVAFIASVPLQYKGITVTITWGVLATGFFIAGTLFKMKVLRMGAMLLFAATLVKLLAVDGVRFTYLEKIIAYIFTGTIILIVSFLYQKFKERIFNGEE